MHAPSTPSAAVIAEPHSCHRSCLSLRRPSRHVTLSSSQLPTAGSAAHCRPQHARIHQCSAAAKHLPAPCWPSRPTPSFSTPPSASLAAEPATSSQPEAGRDHSSGGHAAQQTAAEQQPLQLPQYDPSSTEQLDLVVAGGGPAGLAVAERVSAAGYKARP